MAQHSKIVKGFQGSLDELAQSIGDMSYDQVSVFIERFANDINRQADADLARGRKKLAGELYATAKKLYEAKDAMDSAWKICEPYMKD